MTNWEVCGMALQVANMKAEEAAACFDNDDRTVLLLAALLSVTTASTYATLHLADVIGRRP